MFLAESFKFHNSNPLVGECWWWNLICEQFYAPVCGFFLIGESLHQSSVSFARICEGCICGQESQRASDVPTFDVTRMNSEHQRPEMTGHVIGELAVQKLSFRPRTARRRVSLRTGEAVARPNKVRLRRKVICVEHAVKHVIILYTAS